ncbi:hypothetical protein V9T40_001337 [Parthenolecanium corni]|uniref:Chitin-binding type-2 domain-containing protein n=1 Tax=Parthenolecanium corni TaxID=536013 RepID=A0AAN9Y2L4_9HEMI
MLDEVSCPKKNGRFATSQCDAYVECVDGVGTYKLCPDGLLFDENAHLYGYPCGYPIDIDCTGRTDLQPAQSTELCARQFGYYKYGDSRNCGQFVNCAFGDGYIFTCPDGLAFNERTYKCDWPDEVESCNAEDFLEFSCPEESKSIPEYETKLYPHPSDCQRFFLCKSGRPRLQSCEETYVFNDISGECDSIANVTRW